MPIETIEFKGKHYPLFQTNGNAARFCQPFALEVCKGMGLDVGCSKKGWAFPGSRPIDLSFDDGYHATNLPLTHNGGLWDYITSSHMAEHFIGNLADMFDHWASRLKSGGVMFLYLPDYSQEYWRWENNRKHIHTLTPQIMKNYLHNNPTWNKWFVSGVDAYNSFTVMAERV